MNKTKYFITDYYNRRVIEHIIEKYAMKPMDAVRSFLTSETHALLEDEDNGMWTFSENAIFDMWEVEKITGNPRQSEYIRGE
ncbi:MAG: hypothetical protein J6C33_08200 [Lachnospiraceae bacterium]|nr:hypothetical protein [Lachnospiraceae bacterium]